MILIWCLHYQMNNVCRVIFIQSYTQVMNLLSHTDSQLELNNRNEGNDEKLSWLIEKRCFLMSGCNQWLYDCILFLFLQYSGYDTINNLKQFQANMINFVVFHSFRQSVYINRPRLNHMVVTLFFLTNADKRKVHTMLWY